MVDWEIVLKILGAIISGLTLISIAWGLFYAIQSFGLKREKFTFFTMSLNANVIKQVGDLLLVSIIVHLENKGQTRISARKHKYINKKLGDFLMDDGSDQCKHAGTLKIRYVPDNHQTELLFDWYSVKPSSKISILIDGIYQENDDLEQINYLHEYEDLYLFGWDKIPVKNNKKIINFLTQKIKKDWIIPDDEKLKNFLAQKFNIDWIKTAKIEKSKDSKTIRVSTENTEKRSLSLRLNTEETKVNLEIDDGRTDEFVVGRRNGELNIFKHPETQNIDVDFWLEPNETDDLLVMVWLRPGTYAMKAYFLGKITEYGEDEYWSTNRLFDLMVNKAEKK